MDRHNPYGQPSGYPGYPGQPAGFAGPPGYPGSYPGAQPYPGSSAPSSGHVFSPISFVPCTNPQPPAGTLKFGNQTDGCGELWSAVAKTQWGTIPGKAKDGTCWFPHGGKEHYTKDFCWITSCRPVEMKWNKGSVPELAIQCGYQTDGTGYVYAAIAETKWGRIPGKAKDSTCWYPYGDKEHYTNQFHWLVMS